MSKYPKVKFGDFVEHIVREVELEADKEYPSVGVKWYGEGVHVHEIKSGGSFNASRFEIKANDIIYNDMWARNGSVAIVPSHLDGAVASSHFPTFLPDLTRVLPKYLEFYFKTRTFWDDCENASRGSTGRNQIKKSTFYAIEIPLPPLTEQSRIVAHIESLAARVNEAQRIKEETIEHTDVLFKSELAKMFNIQNSKYPIYRLDEVAEKIEDIPHSMPKAVEDGNKKLVSPKDFTKHGIDFSRCKKISEEDFERLARKIKPRKDDILFSRIGTIGEARLVEIDDDFVASYSIVTVRANLSLLIPKFLLYVLQSPSVLDQAKKGVRAIAMPDLGVKSIKAFQIPVPPLDEQRHIVAYLDGLQAKVNALRELQSQSQEELDALLPSVLDRAFKGEL